MKNGILMVKNKRPQIIYLDANRPIRFEPYISQPIFPNVAAIRTVEIASSLHFLSNTLSQKATDLLIVLGLYTYRPAKYVIVTLEWSLQQDENRLALSFEQIRRNWRANLFSDGHPKERDKIHPCISHRWEYDGTGMDMSIWDYVPVAKKDAIKVAKAYDLVADYCEEHKSGNAEMFRAISESFMSVSKHRIVIPSLTDDEEEHKKRFKEANRTPSDSWFSRWNGTTYADHLFNKERYEKIAPPQLATVFLETLNTFEPFKGSRVTRIEPRSFYVTPEGSRR